MKYDNSFPESSRWDPSTAFDPYSSMLPEQEEHVTELGFEPKALHVCEAGCGCGNVQNKACKPFKFGEETRYQMHMLCPNCDALYVTDATQQQLDGYNQKYENDLKAMETVAALAADPDMLRSARAYLFALRYLHASPDDFNF